MGDFPMPPWMSYASAVIAVVAIIVAVLSRHADRKTKAEEKIADELAGARVIAAQEKVKASEELAKAMVTAAQEKVKTAERVAETLAAAAAKTAEALALAASEGSKAIQRKLEEHSEILANFKLKIALLEVETRPYRRLQSELVGELHHADRPESDKLLEGRNADPPELTEAQEKELDAYLQKVMNDGGESEKARNAARAMLAIQPGVAEEIRTSLLVKKGNPQAGGNESLNH